jgi:hypothetical protein
MDRSADIRVPSATGAEDTDQPCIGRHRAVGEGQAALLIGFVTAITGLLLALDVGLHRVTRPR